MIETEHYKRLFFGIEVHAPWPVEYPDGRLLEEDHRHLTLAFLGNIPYLPLIELLTHFPEPSMKVGLSGYFDSCLFLPPRHPHVVAWHAQFFDPDPSMIAFQRTLSHWLADHQYSIDKREWLPHMTLCRQPFNPAEWKKSFKPLPFYTSSLHLYESIGNLNYLSMWSFSVKPPFEEINHTADMAFIIRGETLQQIYHNAFTALAFKSPEFLDFFTPEKSLNTLDDIVIALNSIVANVDSAIGCPLKAVSFHGEIVALPNSVLQWEMIVDV